jgi:hypothetical protein
VGILSSLFLFISLKANAAHISVMGIDSAQTEGLFLCNAGIVHPLSESICQKAGTGEVCDPSITDSLNCICTSPSPVGDFMSGTIIQDEMRMRKQAFANEHSWSLLVDPNFEFNSEIQDLEINLGSEQFGAQYMLQFCYRGPMQDIQNVGFQGEKVDISQGFYKIMASLISKNKNYSTRLANRALLSFRCDLRNVGLQTAPRKNGTDKFDFPFEDDVLGQVFVPLIDVDSPVNHEMFLPLNSNVSQVPRYCSFKILFTEVPAGMRTIKTLVEMVGGLSVNR